MSLYTRARPKELVDVVGNEGVVSSLTQIITDYIAEKDIPHSFLFQGPTGCGKTTLARILIRELGCDDMDITELNAANTRGIDTIRQVIDRAGVPVLSGGNQAYIFDEAHKITTDAQNAMLKLLEDTPSKTFICVCTTNPNGLLKTIRNRCTTFELQRLRPSQLRQIIERAEKFSGMEILDNELMSDIITAVDGCPRAALVLREMVEGLALEDAKEAVVQATLDEKGLIDLARLLTDLRIKQWDKWKRVSAILEQMKDQEPESMRRGLIGYFRTCLIKTRGLPDGMHFSAILDELCGPPVYTAGELVNMIWKICAI